MTNRSGRVRVMPGQRPPRARINLWKGWSTSRGRNGGKSTPGELTYFELSESINPIAIVNLQLVGREMDSFLRVLTPFFGAPKNYQARLTVPRRIHASDHVAVTP